MRRSHGRAWAVYSRLLQQRTQLMLLKTKMKGSQAVKVPMTTFTTANKWLASRLIPPFPQPSTAAQIYGATYFRLACPDCSTATKVIRPISLRALELQTTITLAPLVRIRTGLTCVSATFNIQTLKGQADSMNLTAVSARTAIWMTMPTTTLIAVYLMMTKHIKLVQPKLSERQDRTVSRA
jgi:hypothetical protein